MCALLIGATAIILPSGVRAETPVCQLCSPDSAPAQTAEPKPLSIEVETTLDFDRVAVSGSAGGTVEVDSRTGDRSVSGEIVQVGGIGIQGSATVRGEPGRAIRLEMPRTTLLYSSTGQSAEVVDLTADLLPSARLGSDGSLRFNLGGRLKVNGDADGDYRGRILLIVDYQ
jgi:hypothetical protein